MRRYARALCVGLLLVLSACSSSDETASEVYAEMTQVVEKHIELAKQNAYDEDALKEELAPLEAKIVELSEDELENATFSERGVAAEGFRDAIQRLSSLVSPSLENEE